MNIEWILKNIDRIKKGVSNGYIFKSNPSTDQLVQFGIFEMMIKDRAITPKGVQQWVKRSGHPEPNFNNCKSMCNLWKDDIDNHNKGLYNQITLKL